MSILESALLEVKFSWNSVLTKIYDPSLVLMMNFDNLSSLGENDTFVADASRYSNNGTVFGFAMSTPGKYGSAFSFNTSSYIEFGQILDPDKTKPFTMGAWANAKGAGWRTIIGTENSFAQIGISASGEAMFGQNGAGGWFVNGGSILLDEWHYIVGVYNRTHASIYIDGTLKAVEEHNFTLNHGVTFIGKYNFGGAEYFNGTIDEVRIWNLGLSAEEIQEQYYSNLYKFNQTQWYLYVNQSNLSVGNYLYFACAADVLGNNCTETRMVSLSTTPPPPGPGPPDGGGGGPGGPSVPASKTYYLPQTSWEAGARVAVAKRDIVKINFQNVNYSLTVASLNQTAVVFSGYQEFTLVTSQKLDLNRDSIFDLSFNLEGVANTTAQIFVQKVQPVSSPLPVKNVSEEPLEENKTPSAQNAPSAFKKSLAVYWTVIVLLVALIALIGAILGVLYHFRRKHGRNHQPGTKGYGELP